MANQKTPEQLAKEKIEKEAKVAIEKEAAEQLAKEKIEKAEVEKPKQYKVRKGLGFTNGKRNYHIDGNNVLLEEGKPASEEVRNKFNSKFQEKYFELA